LHLTLKFLGRENRSLTANTRAIGQNGEIHGLTSPYIEIGLQLQSPKSYINRPHAPLFSEPMTDNRPFDGIPGEFSLLMCESAGPRISVDEGFRSRQEGMHVHFTGHCTRETTEISRPQTCLLCPRFSLNKN